MMKRFEVLLLIAFVAAAYSFTQSVSPNSSQVSPFLHEDLDALIWMQRSAERSALCQQAFAQATLQLSKAMNDGTWTAATEQQGNFSQLPPAVIVDVDETVLDNSPYQAQLILKNQEYGPASWDAWVNLREAKPVPGAYEFLKAADDQQVAIFYVTNRKAHLEGATLTNIELVGFPKGEILCKNERENWGSDKTSRRAEVAKTHRVLLILGDDLNDFVPAKSLGLEQQQVLFRQLRGRWGKRWFMLPNPNYGSWENAAVQGKLGVSRNRRLKLKGSTLRAP